MYGGSQSTSNPPCAACHSPSPCEHTTRAIPHWRSCTPQAGLMWGGSRGICAQQCRWGEGWGCWCPQGLTFPPVGEVQEKRSMERAVRKVRGHSSWYSCCCCCYCCCLLPHHANTTTKTQLLFYAIITTTRTHQDYTTGSSIQHMLKQRMSLCSCCSKFLLYILCSLYQSTLWTLNAGKTPP